LARVVPDKVVPLLQDLVRVGGSFAQAALDELYALAAQGVQSARDALVKIANSGGQFAGAALLFARKLGLMALEGATATAAGISAATLLGIGAVVVGAILIGGYSGRAEMRPFSRAHEEPGKTAHSKQ
jgi:hypothetical protein